MFWKKNVAQTNVLTEEASRSTLPVIGNSPVINKKEKKLSKKDIIVNQLEALQMGQTIRYKFPESHGGDLVVVELDSKGSGTERKYNLSMQKITDGNPGGNLEGFCNTNKPKQVAEFILNSNGEFFAIDDK